MPRNRMIKPEFWGNEQLVECSFGARLLFIGLMNFADDNGLLQNRPKKIKMNIFPADNVDVEKFINELVNVELIQLYESNGHEYIWIINFTKHQRIDKPNYDSPTPNEVTLAKHGFCLFGKKIVITKTQTTGDMGANSTNDPHFSLTNSSNFEQDKTRQDKLSKDKNKDPYLCEEILKIFQIYEDQCKNLAPISFEKRNMEIRQMILTFLEETNDDFKYFETTCRIANELKEIASLKIDLKMLLKNHIGIYNGKYKKQDKTTEPTPQYKSPEQTKKELGYLYEDEQETDFYADVVSTPLEEVIRRSSKNVTSG